MHRAPRICPCGNRVASGEACACQKRAMRASKAAADARRPSARARGYGRKWEEARKGFLAAHPECVGPGKDGRRCGAPATVVDHIKAHRGDMKKFWDRANWQPLCASCHGKKTAREDGSFGRAIACD